MNSNPPTIVVVGGGLSGLAVAYRLKQRAPHARIVVLEKQSRLGGNVLTVVKDGFRIECGPNGFLDSKPSTIGLCRDLGLGDRLLAASEGSRKNRYLFHKGKLRALPGSFASFLSSGVLSWSGKYRLLTEKYRKRSGDVPEDESISQFATRRAGREVADVLADAMVTGIHAGDPKLLSAAACFPRLSQFEREHGSVMRGFNAVAANRRKEAEANGVAPAPQKMWSFRDGLQAMIDSLETQLGSGIVRGVSVKRIQKTFNGWRVHGEGNDTWDADAVVLAAPSYEQAEQLAEVDTGLANEVTGIAYNRIVVVAMGYNQADVSSKNLDGFGFIVPENTRRDILGVQWCSSIFPDRAPPGKVLWRALCGGWNRPEIADWPDEQLIQSVRNELRLTMGVAATPVMSHVVRWPKAIPQYHVGHLARMVRIDENLRRFPGLFLGGNAYRGIAMNDCTEQAEAMASRIVEYLTQRV